MRRVVASSVGETAGRAVNVLLPIVVLYLHGSGLAADGLFLALAFAFFLHGTLSNALTSVFVPLLVQAKEPLDCGRYAACAAGVALLGTGVALWFSAGYFSAVERGLVCVAVWISGMSGLLAAPAVAALGAEHRYAAAGVTWSLRGIPLLAYLVWAPSVPQLALLMSGIALADLLRCVILTRLVRERLVWRGSGVALPFPLGVGHVLASSVIAGMVPLAVRWIASLGEAGVLSTFEMSDRVFAAVASLCTIGLGNVALVYFARTESEPERNRLARRMLMIGLLWSLGWMVALFILAVSLPLLNEWSGRIGVEVLGQVSVTLLVLGISLPGFVLHMLLSRNVIASGQAVVLPGMALAGLVTTVLVAWPLCNVIGVAGLAAGIVAGQYVVLAWMLCFSFGRR